MTPKPPSDEAVEHGVEACYSGGPGEPYYQPYMRCTCGRFKLRAETWEEVGVEMDEHLAEVRGE